MRKWLALACALAACGGNDTSGLDNFIKNMSQALCQWEFRCCTDAEIMQIEMGKFTDEATCEKFANLKLTDEFALTRLGIQQGRIKIDTGLAQMCVDKANMKVCNGTMTTPPPAMECAMDPCTYMLTGKTGAGAACLINGECAKGSRCVGANAGAEGVCVAYQAEGDICNDSTDCDPSVCNLYCAKKDFTCHVRAMLGGACAYKNDPVTMMPTELLLECDPGVNNDVYCDPGTSMCKQLPGDGQPCLAAPLPPGVFSPCDTDPTLNLTCDRSGGMPGVCRAPGMAGADCTNIGCSTKAMLYCDRTVTPPTCMALPGLNQPCQNSGFQCASPYSCNTNMTPATCVAPGQLGDMCNNFSMRCDVTLWCDNQMTPATCQAKLADGSPCTQSQSCLSGQCVFMNGMQVCTPSNNNVQCMGR
jgi:hypothetical protein